MTVKVGWNLGLLLKVGSCWSDCCIWPQGTRVRGAAAMGAEAMGAAGEMPMAASPPSYFGVVENRLAFEAMDYGPVLSGLHGTYLMHFLWPAIR